MSSSGPMSSLNISSEPADVSVPAGTVAVSQARSDSRSSSSSGRNRDSKRRTPSQVRRSVSSIVKSLPKSSHHGPGPGSRPPEIHLHDDRVQTVAVGVDPVDFAKMVGEAKVLISNAQDRACFEGLSKEIYGRACQQIQQLVSISQQLHQSCLEKDPLIGEQIQLNQSKDLSLQQLSSEVKTIKSQLQQQIYQYENAPRIVGHKDSEIQRLMNESQSKDYELSRLQLHCQALEVGLAASSATAVQQSVSAERHESLEMRGAMSTMMEAIQSFSSRVDHVESRNLTDSLPVRHVPRTLPLPSRSS